MLEHRVLAGAQAEHALQELDALAHRIGVRERTEVPVATVLRAAVEAEARVLVAGDHEVGIRLVVAEQDVVARREALDEVVLEQQRLASERVAVTSTEATCDTIIWVQGLWLCFWKYEDTRFLRSRAFHVGRLAALAEHAVHPRQIRQSGNKCLGVEHPEFIIKRVKCAPFRKASNNVIAKVEAVGIRPGNLIEWDKRVWRVLKSYHVHVGGRGGAFMQVEMKDIETGTKTNQRFRTEDKVERAFVDPRDMQYLYQDGDSYVFMDKENYEQLSLPADFLEGRVGLPAAEHRRAGQLLQ